MTDHRSLDEFTGGIDDSEEDEDAVADADAVDEAGSVDDGEAVIDEVGSVDDGEAAVEKAGSVDDGEAAVEEAESVDDDEPTVGERVAGATPATATSRYEPDGAACGACDAEVVRLWVGDDEAVCADCKPW